jgi:cell wall-associated NlpC family hydrolase
MQVPNSASWVAPYIGIPYQKSGHSAAGIDCWRLFRKVMLEKYQIVVKDYPGVEYHSAKDLPRIAGIVRSELEANAHDRWHLICDGKQAVLQPNIAKPGDAILMNIMGYPVHIGVIIAPTWMLHIWEGIDSMAEQYTNLLWRHCIEGIYRHESRK